MFCNNFPLSKVQFGSSYSSEKGFSLVELMVVVSIIGVLATLAIPRFRVFQAKARQAEAKVNLSQIYTLQMSYHGEHDKFADVGATGFSPTGNSCPQNDLGFSLDSCANARYSYSVLGGVDGFFATATSGYGAQNRVLRGCTADSWSIDTTKTFNNSSYSFDTGSDESVGGCVILNDVTRNCGS